MRLFRALGLALVALVAACAPALMDEPTEPTASATETTARLDDTASVASGSDVTFDESYLSLGPGRAFPVLDNPPMVAASSVTWLESDDVVLGTVIGDEAQAFPASQLVYHHIVNTTVAGEPYLVTY